MSNSYYIMWLPKIYVQFFQTLTNVFPNLATQMPHVRILLVRIIARARKDLLVMELLVQVI